MKNVRQYKQLQSQLNIMIADAAALKIEAANKHREYTQKTQAINNLRIEMEKLNNNGELKVSEHALVRYFERVRGYNLEKIEKEILSDKIREFVEKLGGTGSYPNEGYSVVMKDHTVTTIV